MSLNWSECVGIIGSVVIVFATVVTAVATWKIKDYAEKSKSIAESLKNIEIYRWREHCTATVFEEVKFSCNSLKSKNYKDKELISSLYKSIVTIKNVSGESLDGKEFFNTAIEHFEKIIFQNESNYEKTEGYKTEAIYWIDENNGKLIQKLLSTQKNVSNNLKGAS